MIIFLCAECYTYGNRLYLLIMKKFDLEDSLKSLNNLGTLKKRLPLYWFKF